MSALYIPDWSEVLAVSHAHGADSRNPDAWASQVGLWTMLQGGGKTLYDVSGYGNHGTLTNMDPTGWVLGNPRSGGYALDFDGVNQRVEIGSDLGMGGATGLSISAWIKPRTPFADFDGIFTIGAANQRTPWLVGRSGLSTLEFRVDTTTSSLDILLRTSTTLADDTWAHVVATWDGTTAHVYFNAVVDAVSDTSVGNTLPTPNANADIGAANGSLHATMQIASMAIYRRALSASEVQNRYNEPNAHLTLRQRVFPAAVAPAVGGVNQIIGGGMIA